MQDIIQQMFKTVSKFSKLGKLSRYANLGNTRFYALKTASEFNAFTEEDIDKLTKHAEKIFAPNPVPARILNQLPTLIGQQLYYDRRIYDYKYTVSDGREATNPMGTVRELAFAGMLGLSVFATVSMSGAIHLPWTTFVALCYPVFAIAPARVYLDNKKLEFLRGCKQPFWRNCIYDDIKLPNIK